MGIFDSESTKAKNEIIKKATELSASQLSLRAKKEQFIAFANGKIKVLTNKHLAELFDDYRDEFNTTTGIQRKWSFIYREDSSKFWGWLKGADNARPALIIGGNTATHKEFLRLMKQQALNNMREHTQADRGGKKDEQEVSTIRPLMTMQRGRAPNIFACLGYGLQGQFESLEKERRAARKMSRC